MWRVGEAVGAEEDVVDGRREDVLDISEEELEGGLVDDADEVESGCEDVVSFEVLSVLRVDTLLDEELFALVDESFVDEDVFRVDEDFVELSELLLDDFDEDVLFSVEVESFEELVTVESFDEEELRRDELGSTLEELGRTLEDDTAVDELGRTLEDDMAVDELGRLEVDTTLLTLEVGATLDELDIDTTLEELDVASTLLLLVAAPSLYISNRFPAPQNSLPSPGHTKPHSALAVKLLDGASTSPQ